MRSKALAGEKITAFAFNLGEEEIGAVLLSGEEGVKAGDTARLAGKVLEVPVGPELVGRVVDPLGNPLDGGEPIKTKLVPVLSALPQGYWIVKVSMSQ